MAYVLLFTGIILEAVAAGLLKLTNGFKNKLATIFCLLFYGVSYYAVRLSMRVISLGVAYTTWCGCGILLTSLIGIFYYKEKLSKINVLGIVVLTLGVVLLNYA